VKSILLLSTTYLDKIILRRGKILIPEMPASSPHASHPAETLTTCGFGLERAAKESEKGKTVYQATLRNREAKRSRSRSLRMGKLIGVGKENDEENKD
jgi:hypothetical protein